MSERLDQILPPRIENITPAREIEQQAGIRERIANIVTKVRQNIDPILMIAGCGIILAGGLASQNSPAIGVPLAASGLAIIATGTIRAGIRKDRSIKDEKDLDRELFILGKKLGHAHAIFQRTNEKDPQLGSSASAVILGQDTLLTAKHAVVDSGKVEDSHFFVITPGFLTADSGHKGHTLTCSPDRDLAIIKFSENYFSADNIKVASTPVKTGDRISYPGKDISANIGYVRQIDDSAGHRRFIISLLKNAIPGNSGSLCANINGELIGIVSGMIEKDGSKYMIAEAVSMEELQPLLDETQAKMDAKNTAA
ncbi:MAG: serine protease [Candidatus Gracilibacteria bacterium]|jgi:V8-like Glu-specific endopeptidase